MKEKLKHLFRHAWRYSRNQNVRVCKVCPRTEYQMDGKWFRDDFYEGQRSGVSTNIVFGCELVVWCCDDLGGCLMLRASPAGIASVMGDALVSRQAEAAPQELCVP